VHVGETVTLRQSVRDFETDDSEMPYVAFGLLTSDDAWVALGTSDEGLIDGTFDVGTPPMGTGDVLNWKATVELPATVTLVYEDGSRMETDSAGLSLYLYAIYRDGTGADAIAAYATSESFLEVAP
jgi:hypothetical protein